MTASNETGKLWKIMKQSEIYCYYL